MGADWYFIQGFYGYEVCIFDNDKSFTKTIEDLKCFADNITDEYEIAAILSEFHSRMEGCDEEELKEMYKHSSIIIGFKTNNNLSEMMERAKELRQYIMETPFFEFKYSELAKNPELFFGLNVIEHIYELFFWNKLKEDDSDVDSDDDSVNDSEYEDSKEENDADTSYDEYKVVPITEINKSKVE